MPQRIVEFDEARIDKIAAQDRMWDMTPCDLEGHDLGVHTWLKIQVTTDNDGEITEWAVIDCDRKDEK